MPNENGTRQNELVEQPQEEKENVEKLGKIKCRNENTLNYAGKQNENIVSYEGKQSGIEKHIHISDVNCAKSIDLDLYN
jgi:hypothetical protein